MKVGKIKDLKNLILLSIGIIAIIIVTIIGICIKNKTKETNSKAKEKFDNEEILINVNEEVEEFASIEDLEQETDETEKEEDSKDIDKTNNKNNNTNSSLPYYIKVNYGAQVVTIYTQDENGEYTVPYKAMVCSTGVATPTSGVYSIPARWEWLGLQGDVYGHYSTQIKGNILFHSVPYLRGDKSSLEYWEYDKLGTYASAGCIRLTVADAKWIFYNCARGTKVEFYSSSNPGPLGKPSARKISSYPDYLRNWDPTDPDSSNPWHTYKNEDNKKENNDNKNNTNQNETTNTNIVSNVIENEVSNNITNETTGDNKGNITTNTIDNSIKQNVTENSVVNNTTNTKSSNTNTNVTKTNEQKDNNQSSKTTLNTMTSEIL